MVHSSSGIRFLIPDDQCVSCRKQAEKSVTNFIRTDLKSSWWALESINRNAKGETRNGKCEQGLELHFANLKQQNKVRVALCLILFRRRLLRQKLMNVLSPNLLHGDRSNKDILPNTHSKFFCKAPNRDQLLCSYYQKIANTYNRKGQVRKRQCSKLHMKSTRDKEMRMGRNYK